MTESFIYSSLQRNDPIAINYGYYNPNIFACTKTLEVNLLSKCSTITQGQACEFLNVVVDF